MFRYLKLADVFNLIPKPAIRGTHTPIIAVLDTTVQTTHPEFTGRVWNPSGVVATTTIRSPRMSKRRVQH